MRLTALLLAVLTVLGVAGCNSTPTSPSVNVTFSTTDIRVGTGVEATNGRTVTVNYTGWLYSTTAAGNKGTQFDTSVGKTPFTFVLGARQVITGWDQGVLGMRVGGQRRLIIPASLGYGSQANGPIPANSTLIFEVELLAVQ